MNNTTGAQAASGSDATFRILNIIGSPFAPPPAASIDDDALPALYEIARTNKISMLFLDALRDRDRLGTLRETHEEEEQRYFTFRDTIGRVARALEDGGVEHAFYKTVKPYRAILGDIDIITLSPGNVHRQAAIALLKGGYDLALKGVIDIASLNDDAALQKAADLAVKPTFKTEHISPTGTNFIDPSNDILIDLRKELAVNHLIYMNRNNFHGHTVKTPMDNGVAVSTLKPEYELSCLMMHSVMENLFLLGDYYSFLYVLNEMDGEQIRKLVEAVRQNHIISGARQFVSLVAALHEAATGMVPDKVNTILAALKTSEKEAVAFRAAQFRVPHRYALSTFLGALMEKLKEPVFRRSAIVQCFHTLDPRLMKLVVSSLRERRRREIY